MVANLKTEEWSHRMNTLEIRAFGFPGIYPILSEDAESINPSKSLLSFFVGLPCLLILLPV